LRRGIRERLTPEGEILIELDEDQARGELAILRSCAVEGVAICLLHSWINPVHEIGLRELVQDVLGDIPISIWPKNTPGPRRRLSTCS
jgi:N-methylhydantoinase A